MVRLERFEKWYGKVQAVRPVDLDVVEGETFALLGPNGGGKTTILRAVVGLHRPSGGRILVGGRDVWREPRHVKRLLSYVPQRVTMPDLLTAREIVTLFARLKNVSLSRVDEVLEQFALSQHGDRFVREFSGGMLQRLGLAVAFLNEVPLFVLDEPTLNLDARGLRVFRRMLRQLKERGTTILFASHIAQNALQLADRVAVIAEGELLRVETVAAFEAAVTGQTVVRVVLREASAAIEQAAVDAGAVDARRNGVQMSFRARPEQRLEVIRAIERAGGEITEFHTEPPDWGALLSEHFGIEGDVA